MKTQEEVVEKVFSLPTEIVTVKFVPKKKGMAANVEDNHVISGGMLTNSVKTFMCPLQRKGGLANILNKKEKDFLEEMTGKDLSVYGDFWVKFRVKLYKDNASNTYNLNDPMSYIAIKILENYPDDIAKSWKQRNDKISYQFAITRPGEEINEKKVRLDIKAEAFKIYGRMEHNKTLLLGALKLLTNQPISEASTLDWLQGRVQEIVDSTPAKFVSLVNDPSFETQILVKRGVEMKVIKKNGNKYETLDGLELCNSGETPTFANTVRFLDNDKNQEVRLLIEARIDNAK
jgi:hypothetical protein|tara:strand:- start:9579 stop:10445 length:867 start_codon:yes stop_codon:yes gene_type:complete